MPYKAELKPLVTITIVFDLFTIFKAFWKQILGSSSSHHFCSDNISWYKITSSLHSISSEPCSVVKLLCFGIRHVYQCSLGLPHGHSVRPLYTMMKSSNGDIFRVTGHLCEEFTGPLWVPHTKASDAELWSFSLICVWINGWINNREAGDLRRAHYDVSVMVPMD